MTSDIDTPSNDPAGEAASGHQEAGPAATRDADRPTTKTEPANGELPEEMSNPT